MIKLYSGRLAAFLFICLAVNMVAQAQQDAGSPRQQAVKLLRKNLRVSGLNQSAVDSYLVTDAYKDGKTGDLIVYLQQTHKGIPVFNKIGVYVFRNDSLVQKAPNYIAKIETKAPAKTSYSIDGSQAIQNAASRLAIPLLRKPQLVTTDDARKHYVFTSINSLKKNVNSDLVWLPSENDATLRLAWNVRVFSDDGLQDWYVRVDAESGEVLEKNSLILSEGRQTDDGDPDGCNGSLAPISVISSDMGGTALRAAAASIVSTPNPLAPPAVTSVGYRVFAYPLESRNFGPRTLETDPWLKAGSSNNAVSLGWHFDNNANYNYTRGNNVWAHQDLTGTDDITGISDVSTTSIPTLTFDRANDTSLSPFEFNNARAALDNLFYWNNIMHDISYQYGFDEAAGNFQASNQSRGGVEGDYVHAFSSDGLGINNANFSTPADGESPIMRMYQWNTSVTPHFHVNSPSDIVADYANVENVISLKTQLSYTGAVTGDVVYVNDPSGTTHQACSGSLTNAAALSGKIALIDRGGSSCSFSQKIKLAQTSGAIAVLMANNVSTAPVAMGPSTDNTLNLSLTIPAVMITQADALTIKNKLAASQTVNVTLSATGNYVDGSLDNGIVSHEYTHGISTRLTGGPSTSNCLINAEQMGEGWSDYLALMVTTNWAAAVATDGTKSRSLGTYALNVPATNVGIRNYPYSTNMAVNPWDYSKLATQTSGEVHNIGEIWCATIWDMTWNIIQQEGIDADLYHGVKGNNIALQLVMTGLKYQPCSPGFIDGRDAILKADSLLYGYRHKCAIWNAFARRGMGINASQGSSKSYLDQTADFTLPSGVSISQTASKTALAQGDNVTYTLTASCNCSALTNISVVDTLAHGINYVSSSSGGVYTAPYVKFDGLNFAQGETKTFTVQANVTGAYATPDTLIKDTRDPAGYTWSNNVSTGSTIWVNSTTRAHSGSNSWFAKDNAGNSDLFFMSGDLLMDTISTLSFWHYYDTDPTYDGGVVEISTDAGGSWQDLGPYMIQNGYNLTIDPYFNTFIGARQAFSGSSGGAFINTVVRLTSFAGKTARIRFRFTADPSVGGDGWYVDDIVLTNESGAVNVVEARSGATLLSRASAVAPFAVAPLPVKFTGFEAVRQDKKALLHWTVNGEIDLQKYVVERSADGVHFAAIGEVAANGARSGVDDYTFTDVQPLDGANYYRISGVDLDGKITYSGIRVLTFARNGIVVKVMPVPTFNHTVQLDIDIDGDNQMTATLVNMVGQIVKVYNVRKGMNTLSLDNFTKGIYLLKVQAGKDKAEIRKVVIQ